MPCVSFETLIWVVIAALSVALTYVLFHIFEVGNAIV